MSKRASRKHQVVAAWLLATLLGTTVAACGSSSTTEEPGPAPVDAGQDVLAEAEPDVVDASDAGTDADVDPGPICKPDSDGDGIPDDVEGAPGRDTDDDDTPDYLDLDSDDDTIPDAVEGDVDNAGCRTPQDSDGDGAPDYVDTDSDDNGLLDVDEVTPEGLPYDPQLGAADSDGDKYPDYADPDNDDDGLLDVTELDDGALVNTDDDPLPDLDDIDSDDDGIADGYEGSVDFDEDGDPNFRDLDSDDDGVPDACEAGPNHDVSKVPRDTDVDGRYDFIDLDSDGDGLLDAKEDLNGNCDVDVMEGETDRLYADSDGDDVSDLIEVVLGSDPQDHFSTPESIGQFYFVLPYMEPAQPQMRGVPIDLGLQRADVGVFIDTTGTMGEEIAALKSGVGSVIASMKTVIPDVAAGVAGHDDYPVAPYGVAGQDQPFYLPAPSGMITTVQTQTEAAIAALTLHNGNDAPESQVAGMWKGVTNGWLQWPGTLEGPVNLPAGRFGALGFRENALPILVEITDAPFHNGRRANDSATLHDPYSFNGVAPYPAPTVDDLVDEMNTVGAKFIGIAANDGIRSGDPYEDLAYLADATGSLVPPSAFGGATCNTTLGGNPLGTPDGANGTCRLVFDIRQNGIGLTARLVDAVTALVNALEFDVRVVAVSDQPTAENGWIDSVDEFVEFVEVSVSGGDDPTEPSEPCAVLPFSQVADVWEGAKGLAPGGDTYWDTVRDATASLKVCYNLGVLRNQTILPKDDIQIFHAQLQVRAKNGNNPVELDFGPPRDVLFLIPAKPQ
jgi:hypothetical protein